ncbi:class I SAM-dependent methyltransferase [Candidatus Woesearchaeota archaeon]|nr:class I SAM-dependent methyltransferase [Candidatus Woesearchaeota archaeon]
MHDRFRMAFDWVPQCTRLLDVGGDKGSVTNEYLRKAKNVFMVESNKDAVDYCHKQFPDVKSFVGFAEKLHFKNGFFDVVVMTETLEHVRAEKKALSEVFRVLKNNGVLILSTPHKGLFSFMDVFNLKFRFPFLYRLFKGSAAEKSYIAEPDWHRHYSFEDYKELLGNMFVIEKIHRGGLFVWPFCWFLQDGILHFLFRKNPAWIDAMKGWFMDVDYGIDYGRFAFNIMVLARKQTLS